jgi:hypothetical protein
MSRHGSTKRKKKEPTTLFTSIKEIIGSASNQATGLVVHPYSKDKLFKKVKLFHAILIRNIFSIFFSPIYILVN